MSNVVKDIRHDIADRIGTKFNPGAILRAMNRIYKEINRELFCVEDTLEIPAGTFSDTVKTYVIPSNMIKIFNIVPGTITLYDLVYVPKERWNPNEYLNYDAFTMLDGNYVFGNVGALASFTFHYYSTGLELVDAEDEDFDSDTEINTPEWDEQYWSLLMYETCFELVPDYPLIKQDILKAAKVRTLLQKANKNLQGVTPTILGGPGRPERKRDPNYVDGLWVTR